MFAAGSIIGLDPPEHTRLRKLVASAFTVRRVEALRPQVAIIVSELIDALLDRPQPADLVTGFSLPLPVQVICEMLGVPAEDVEQFHAWSDTILGDWQGDSGQIMTALADLYNYFARLIEIKRAQPADDLMTALIAARDHADRLSEEELTTLGCTLLIGGHETTANQINLSLLVLLDHPAELAKLRADQELIPGAVEELMRYVRLGGGLPLARVTTEDVQLGGITIRAGETVLPLFATANRDPSAFADPDRFDISRAPANHLAFGAGVHYCLGARTCPAGTSGGVLRPGRPDARAAAGHTRQRTQVHAGDGAPQPLRAAGQMGRAMTRARESDRRAAWPRRSRNEAHARSAGGPRKLVLTRAQMYSVLGYQSWMSHDITLAASDGGRSPLCRNLLARW